MTDVDYCDMLRLRALAVVQKMERELRCPGLAPGNKPAAHVSIERIEKAAVLGESLRTLAKAASITP